MTVYFETTWITVRCGVVYVLLEDFNGLLEDFEK